MWASHYVQQLDAIVQAPKPENVQQLRSFLGLLNYYGKFIPNLATIVHPLNQLLRHGTQWKWDSKCASAFVEAKQALISSQVLVHYDPTLPITLAGDASAYGIGAVISHTLPDGSEHPSPLPPALSQLMSVTMPSWRKKLCHWYLASRNSTSISMGGSLPW